MALKYWFPMTDGTIKNNGTNGDQFTSNAFSLQTNGKLGKCIKTLSTSSISGGMTAQDWVSAKGVSFAGWFYFPESEIKSVVNASSSSYTVPTGTLIGYNSYGGAALTWSAEKPYVNGHFNIYGTVRTSAGGLQSGGGSITSYLDKWVHLAATIDFVNQKIQLYVNGSPINAGTSCSAHVLTPQPIAMNASQISGGNGPGLSIPYYCNDIRVYDEPISPREVAELAKGLVLHYPLNNNGFGQQNLLKNSNFLEGTNGFQGYTATSATCTKQTDCMKVVSSSASGGFYSSNFDTIATGDMTTFSAYVKADNNMIIYIGTDGSGNGSCQAYTVGTTWQRISISKAKTTNNANLRVYGNGTFYVKYMKYELGSVVTPWVPNSADTTYTTMGLNGTTVADTSGYCHNGTATALTYSSDTPRYSVSPYFNGSTSKIAVPNIYTTSVKNTQMSFAFWMKRDDYDDLYPHYMYNDICSIYMYPNDQYAGNGYGLRISWKHDTASSSNGNTWATGRTIPADEWHHVCFTTKDGVMKLYIDGVMHSVINDRSSTGQYIGNYNNGFLGYRLNNGEVWSYGGELSDFRIYATALTADQVKQLYEAPISLANNGTLFANEFNET